MLNVQNKNLGFAPRLLMFMFLLLFSFSFLFGYIVHTCLSNSAVFDLDS